MAPRPAAFVLAAAFALAAAPASAAETDWAKLLGETGVDLGQAIEKGLSKSGEGVPFHAELEADKGTVVWSIDVAQGRRTCNVVLAGRTGEVLEKEVEDEDHSDAVAASKVTLHDALKTALGTAAGRAVEAHLRMPGGKPVVTVKVFGEAGLVVVRIDGATGQVLAGADANPEKPAATADEAAFTDVFRVEPGEWASRGTNPWFVLEPGTVRVLEGKEDGEDARLTITVLDETRKVDGVETRVVEEREEAGGKVVEVSRNFFAISTRTNDVYYFGEEVDVYRDGKVASHEGAWLSGVNGARFGLMMPGTPLLGARYHQEVAPGVAMDRAEIVSLTERIETPAGTFEGCLKVSETTPLEKGGEAKVYAAGIGLVRDANLRLVRHGRGK